MQRVRNGITWFNYLSSYLGRQGTLSVRRGNGGVPSSSTTRAIRGLFFFYGEGEENLLIVRQTGSRVVLTSFFGLCVLTSSVGGVHFNSSLHWFFF